MASLTPSVRGAHRPCSHTVEPCRAPSWQAGRQCKGCLASEQGHYLLPAPLALLSVKASCQSPCLPCPHGLHAQPPGTRTPALGCPAVLQGPQVTEGALAAWGPTWPATGLQKLPGRSCGQDSHLWDRQPRPQRAVVPGASGSLVVLAAPNDYNYLGPGLLSTVSGMDPNSHVPLLLCSQHPRDPDVENERWSL